MFRIRCFCAFATTLLFTNVCLAQEPEGIVKQFVHDELKIWSSPARLHGSDALWIGALANSTAVLLIADPSISHAVAGTDDWTHPSHIVSASGSSIPIFLAPTALLAIGKLSHHDEVSRMGSLGLMAVAHAGVVVQVMKQIAGRERPTSGNGQGEFRKGGSSFPSGHAMTAWAFATVVARQSHSTWIKVGSYSFAAAVGVSRVGGRSHFPSDVLVGSAFGYLIGRYMTPR